MKVRAFLIRSTELIVNPASEFKLISEEDLSIGKINKNHSIFLALIVSFASLIGKIFENLSEPVINYLFIGINTVIVFFLILSYIYLSGKAVRLLGQNVKKEEKSSNYYALASYAQLPFILVLSLIKIFPSLLFLIFLSLYSAYVFFMGLPVTTKVPAPKRIEFTALSMLIMLVSFVLVSELFTLMYKEIIDLFTTFATG